MRVWPCTGLVLGLSAFIFAQQTPAQQTPAQPDSRQQNSSQQDSSQDGSTQQDSLPSAPAPTSDQNSSASPSQPATSPANSSAQTGNSATQHEVPNQPPPRDDEVQVQDLDPAVGESSSKDAPVDLDAPADDAKKHPESSRAVANAEAASESGNGVTELHSWDPHKAAKDVEVGDFYFRRKNYHAAEARYRDALLYKDDDAEATMRLAICLEKLGIFDDALAEYQSYLRILPHGSKANEAEKAIARLTTRMSGK
jgi:tetratricopeptide (TPR) repeat protein